MRVEVKQMAITLSSKTEAQLRRKAAEEGREADVVADDLLSALLDWEEQDRLETIEGLRRGDRAAAEGRERPLSQFLAEQREKYGFSAEWPFVTESEPANADA
jgi:hypothetical protein